MFTRLASQSKICLNHICKTGPSLNIITTRLASLDYYKNVPRLSEEEIKAWNDKLSFFPPVPPKIGKNLEEDIELAEKDGVDYNPRRMSIEQTLNLNIPEDMPTVEDDKKPGRDVKNFPRPNTQYDRLYPAPTRFYFIPDSWFRYFYDKTGVTGPYVFGTGFLTFLLSKEYLVVDHENISGGYFIALLAFLGYKFGPKFREVFNAEADAEANLWLNWQRGVHEYLIRFIENEKGLQEMTKRQGSYLFDAKRENVKLQIEAEFRRRQMVAYKEALQRLNYLVAKQTLERQYQQQHMVNWIIENVRKAITPEQEKEALKKCISDLKLLSTKHQISTV